MNKPYDGKPLISILIPSYNREKYISETLSCAISQSYDNIEIILVDNASTDKTWELCQKISKTDSRIKIYRNKENIGPVNNWKKCISYASGEYAKILWSDDLMASDFIEKTIRLFSDDVGFVFTSVVVGSNFDLNGRVHYRYGESGLYLSSKYIEDVMLGLRGQLPVSPGCAIFRLSDLKSNLVTKIESPSFDDFANHGAGPDLLLFLLTASHYPMVGFINEPLSFFREHGGSISLSMDRLDLYDRYQQVKLWFCFKFLNCHEQTMLSSVTWVQRALVAKGISRFSSIERIYGAWNMSPSFLCVVKFFLYKFYGKIRNIKYWCC